MGSHVRIGPGAEFDVVRRMLAVWGPRARGIGDDAAVCDIPAGQRLVISSDTSVDHIHFRREWMTLRQIARRATVAALSDLAAMAARPEGVLLALTLPARDQVRVEEIAHGIGDAVAECDTIVLGGDVSAGSELALSLTVIGATAHPLGRNRARPGDAIFVTGTLGGPACALAALRTGGERHPWCVDRFIHPKARVREAQWLAEQGASSMIDISDGLGSELTHLAAASSVRLVVDADQVPIRGCDGWRGAFASGEEYELLLTAPPTVDTEEFASRFGLPLTRIGAVNRGARGEVALTKDGVRVDLTTGHDHFSS